MPSLLPQTELGINNTCSLREMTCQLPGLVTTALYPVVVVVIPALSAVVVVVGIEHVATLVWARVGYVRQIRQQVVP